jgi:hypothetical protein
MAEAVVTMTTLLGRTMLGMAYMDRDNGELGLDPATIYNLEFVRPFQLWPHVEVCSHNYTKNSKLLAAFKGSPYRKYSPRDIALLEDSAKREIYIDTIWQLAVSAASGYTWLAYPRSSDTFGDVSAKRGNIIIVLPRRSATRGSATEVRGYTGRAYPRSADRHDTVPEHRGNK